MLLLSYKKLKAFCVFHNAGSLSLGEGWGEANTNIYVLKEALLFF